MLESPFNPARSVILAFALHALIQYSSVNQTLICWCNRNGKSLFASRTQPWSFIEFHKALNKKSTILIHWIKNLHFSTNIDEIHLISSFKVWNNFFMKKVFFYIQGVPKKRPLEIVCFCLILKTYILYFSAAYYFGRVLGVGGGTTRPQ